MPDPIQSSVGPNQSYYDPSEQVSRAPEAAAPPPPPPPAPAASSPPSSGTQLLLEKYGSGQQDCKKHLVAASLSAAGVAVGAMATLTGIGTAPGAVTTALALGKTASDLTSYAQCEAKNEVMSAAAADCTSKGGVLLAGAGDSDAVCLRTTTP
jgi:hypothetical protein